MTTMPIDQDRLAAQRVNFAILVGNDVLQHGLEAVLRRLPLTASVRVLRGWTSAEALDGAAGDRVDLLITASGERTWSSASAEEARRAGVKVLMLLDQSEAEDPGAVGPVTADGFLIRQELTAEALESTVGRIRAGELPMPAGFARRLLARAGAEPEHPFARPRVVPLTGRQTETLALLAAGLSNKQIATRLRISEHGAKRLVASVLLKLGSPNRTTAVVTAIREGLIDGA
ncbi:LuxR C-terminal-related transcriptional regulator [Kitasatospora sp. NPDC004240]